MSNKSRLGREIMGRRTTANTRGSHDSPSQGRLETGYKSHQSHGGKFRLVGPLESGIWIPKQLPSCGQSQKRGSSTKPPPGAPSSPAHLHPSAWRPFSHPDPGVTRCRQLLGQGYPADPCSFLPNRLRSLYATGAVSRQMVSGTFLSGLSEPPNSTRTVPLSAGSSYHLPQSTPSSQTPPEHAEFPNSQLFLTAAQYESSLISLIHIAPLEKQAR